MEFLDDAGYDAKAEIDEKNDAEKLHETATFLPYRSVLGLQRIRLKERQKERQTEGERHEEEMVRRSDGKLPSGQNKHVHNSPSFLESILLNLTLIIKR